MRLDGAQRHTQPLTHSRLRKALSERHLEHLPLLGPQQAHEPAHVLSLVMHVDRIGGRGQWHLSVFLESRAWGPPGLTAVPVDQPPPGNHRDERRLGRACRIEPTGVLPHIDEDLLDRLFRILPRGGHLERQRPDQPAVDGQAFLHRIVSPVGHPGEDHASARASCRVAERRRAIITSRRPFRRRGRPIMDSHPECPRMHPAGFPRLATAAQRLNRRLARR